MTCIVCGSPDLADVLKTPPVPIVCNQVMYDATEARRVDRAVIALVGCRQCGHVFNGAFDASFIRYDDGYENSLMCSARYRKYALAIIDDLFATRDLTGGTVVEIGCGRGEFMHLLCKKGMRRGVGFDPGRPREVSVVDQSTLTIINQCFDATVAPKHADLVCARHVLEHLVQPVSLLAEIRSAYESRPQCVLLLEVPNGCYTFEHLGIWDLIYEHVSYFSPTSLSWALAAAGFQTDRMRSTFGNQCLLAEAKFDASARCDSFGDAVSDGKVHFASFQADFHRTLNEWQHWLDIARQHGRRIALWGAGSKGNTFLNLADPHERRSVMQVIDVNPLKSGAFVAGTGHPISSPEALRSFQPDIILLMNPEYESEVRLLVEVLDIGTELVVVSGRGPPGRCRAILNVS